MTAASARDILRLRLASQLLAPRSRLQIADVARHFLAMQAQDFAQALWALGARVPGSTRADVLAALGRGEIVRSWPMRGTLHWVAPEDLGWMLRLTVPRQHSSIGARQRQLGLEDRDFARAADAARAALSGGRRLSRADLLAAVYAGGVSTEGQRGNHLVAHLCELGVAVQGPPDGAAQAFVSLDEWVPRPRRLGREESLGELALRYFTAHGPATLSDLTWWSKITVADARVGIAVARPALRELEHDGATYWAAAPVIDTAPARVSARTILLPGFDEYLLGYRDRSHSLAPEHADRVVPGGNGVFLPMIVASGRITGTWRRAVTASKVTVTPVPFTAASAAQTDAVAREAARYGAFLGLPAVVAGAA